MTYRYVQFILRLEKSAEVVNFSIEESNKDDPVIFIPEHDPNVFHSILTVDSVLHSSLHWGRPNPSAIFFRGSSLIYLHLKNPSPRHHFWNQKLLNLPPKNRRKFLNHRNLE